MRLPMESLVFDLPENIVKAKLAGEIDLAKEMVETHLKKTNITPMLRDRLIVEKELLNRLTIRYRYNREETIAIGKRRIEGFTEEEFDACEKNGDVDFMIINGEKRYVSSCIGALIQMHTPLYFRQTDKKQLAENDESEAARLEMMEKGELAYRIKMKHTVHVDDDKFIPGEVYTAHLPIPAPAAQQPADKIEIEADSDGFIAPQDEKQRTVAFKRFMTENKPFTVTYTYENRVKYVDPFKDAPQIVYPDVPAPTADDLSEQAPHGLFTPYLKALAKYIAGDETRPLYLAKRVYDYITQNVRYSYMRSYILVEHHAEFTAINQKGDCGMQAILFITLCRILGIHARWQSGRTAESTHSGCHDWAQFYTEEFGWLFADPSYGGGAWRKGNMSRWAFYFGNLDPFRMIANSRYLTNLNPVKRFERYDPYDNQDGEVECTTRGFDSYDYDGDAEILEFEKID